MVKEIPNQAKLMVSVVILSIRCFANFRFEWIAIIQPTSTHLCAVWYDDGTDASANGTLSIFANLCVDPHHEERN